jgi:FecR protein
MKKRVQRFVVAVVAAAFVAGCTSAPQTPASLASPVPPAPTVFGAPASHGKAIVRSVHGDVTYAINGVFAPLKINMELAAGTTIKSGPGSDSYLQVNGFTSTVKVTEKSEVELTRMDVHGAGLGADTETVLTVKYGTILYSVRKLSANSRYEVHTPNGVAEVRGTDFQVTVTALPAGKVLVTYLCVTGQLLVSAEVEGQNVTKVLTTGQQWVPGAGDVTDVPLTTVEEIGGPMSVQYKPLPPPPVVLQQPFNGSGAPNPAVDVGHDPFQHVTPVTIPNALPPPPVVFPVSPSPTHR